MQTQFYVYPFFVFIDWLKGRFKSNEVTYKFNKTHNFRQIILLVFVLLVETTLKFGSNIAQRSGTIFYKSCSHIDQSNFISEAIDKFHQVIWISAKEDQLDSYYHHKILTNTIWSKSTRISNISTTLLARKAWQSFWADSPFNDISPSGQYDVTWQLTC